MRPASQRGRVLAVGVALTLCTACGMLRGTPTPLPWVPTSTPIPTGGSQSGHTTTPTAIPATATPGPTPEPTLSATPTSTPTPDDAEEQAIYLDAPLPDESVGNPIRVQGRTRWLPFEGTLVVRVLGVNDEVLAEKPILAQGEIGEPATFKAEIRYGGRPGPGRLEVIESSPRDGSIVAAATVELDLEGYADGGFVEVPAPLEEVTLPIKLLARVGLPSQEVNVTVAWEDGTQFSHVFETLPGLDGRGLLFVPLGVLTPGFSHPDTQAGSLQLHALDGAALAYQPIQILPPDDPKTMGTDVYWVREETVVPQRIRIPRTLAVGRASVEALLWGPVPQNSEGYTSYIPGPADVLGYPGRSDRWGERPRLLSLRIDDGTAYADFSVELSAHSGGALVTTLIREQIEATLTQFSTVDDVVISIQGVTGVLEP